MKCEMKKMMILRRRAVVLLLCVAVAAAAFAEEDKNAAGNGKVTYFQFSLFPGLGVNGWRTWEYTNWASVNLLGDVSMNERAFTLSGIWSAVKGDAQGVQIAGLVNYAGQGRGLMLSGLVNALKGEYDGLTVSGLANVAGGRVRGVQVSGGMNLSGTLCGVQLTGIAAIAKGGVKGVQLAGVMDYAGGDMDGVQLAGLTGIAVGDVEGAQISGAVNFSLEMSGVQMAAFANVVRGDVEGVQISAVANCAREVEGVQIGLVNVAEESDVPIGLINVIEDGEMSMIAAICETAKYPIKPDAFRAILETADDETPDQRRHRAEQVRALETGMKGKRLITFSGVLKEIRAELAMIDPEDADMIGEGDGGVLMDEPSVWAAYDYNARKYRVAADPASELDIEWERG